MNGTESLDCRESNSDCRGSDQICFQSGEAGWVRLHPFRHLGWDVRVSFVVS